MLIVVKLTELRDKELVLNGTFIHHFQIQTIIVKQRWLYIEYPSVARGLRYFSTQES
jgi:hypothetical protein